MSIGQQFQCPRNDELFPINGTFPDPINCQLYYHRDSNRNEFKCKNGGLYKVSISLGVQFLQQLFGEILVNNEVEGRLLCTPQPTTVTRDRFISRTILLNLQPDDIISLRVRGSLHGTVTNSILNIIHISK